MIAVVWMTPALRDVVDLLWLKLSCWSRLLESGPAVSAQRSQACPARLRSRTMFDYRYHALSLAAVLFALAVGVLIGVAIGDSNLVSSAKNGIVHNLRIGSGRRAAAGREQLQTQLSRRGNVRERPLPARRPRPAHRHEHRPGVPRRLLQHESTASCAARSPRPAATGDGAWPCASRSDLSRSRAGRRRDAIRGARDRSRAGAQVRRARRAAARQRWSAGRPGAPQPRAQASC